MDHFEGSILLITPICSFLMGPKAVFLECHFRTILKVDASPSHLSNREETKVASKQMLCLKKVVFVKKSLGQKKCVSKKNLCQQNVSSLGSIAIFLFIKSVLAIHLRNFYATVRSYFLHYPMQVCDLSGMKNTA